MEITKIFKFEAAHRLLNSWTTRCQCIHGHSYIVEVCLEGKVNPDTGMIIDFGEIKSKFGHILDAFDHSMVVSDKDAVLVKLVPYLSSRYIIFPGNPTAENMASYFLSYISNILLAEVSCNSVTVWETATGKAKCQSTLLLPPALPLGVSSAIVEHWNEQEMYKFLNNNGIVLAKTPLIISMGMDTTLKDIVTIQASFS